MLVSRIFIVLFPIFAIVLIGYLYARMRPLDMAAANRMNMEIFTPALLLNVLADKSFDLTAYWQLALAGLVIVLGSGLLVWPLLRFLSVSPRTFIPAMMFTNTGNIGLPVSLFAFGEAGLNAAVMLFIATNTVHLTLGISIVNPHAHWRSLLKTPMIIATVLGLSLSALQWPLPDLIAVPIDMLGKVSIPLMLFALGVRLIDIDLSDWRIGVAGAILCPLTGGIMLAILWPWLSLSPLQLAVLLSFAVLPPAVMNYIFAEQYCQEPRKVASIVLLGNVFSLLTLSLSLAWGLSLTS